MKITNFIAIVYLISSTADASKLMGKKNAENKESFFAQLKTRVTDKELEDPVKSEPTEEPKSEEKADE
mgnify:CR=1 FL=1